MDYTQNGSRPDLAAIEVNPPESYIGTKILPIVPVADKSGTIYYATVTADSAAQTSRSAGTAPTSTQISDSNTSYTCLEREKRGSITPDEAKQMGGIDKADMVGAKWAKRQVMNALETSICAELLGLTASDAFDAAKLQSDVQTGLDSIRLYEGRTALVASTMVLKKIVQALLDTDGTKDIFSRLITGTNSAQAAQGLSFSAWMNGLAFFLGVDDVLAGDSAIWNAGTYAGKFALVKLDASNDPLSHKWMPIFGKTYQFLPDGIQPWQVISVADLVAHNNHYDATMWYDTTVLNSGAAYIFEGVV